MPYQKSTGMPNKAAAMSVHKEKRPEYTNIVRFSGRLVQDTIMSFTTTGKAISKNSLAVWQPGKDAQGKENPTMFFNLVFWENEDVEEGDTVGSEFSMMEKGALIKVEGRLSASAFKDKMYYTITLTKYRAL